MIAPLDQGEADLPVEAELSLGTFERLTAPVIGKALGVCRRLLTHHELTPSDIAHVVMVGGPSAIPLVRRMVEAELGTIASGALDPMTLVARGAALQAAALSLPAVAPASAPAPSSEADARTELHLRHPSMCRDPRPYLVGQVLNPKRSRLHRVWAERSGSWQSEPATVDEDHTFLLELALGPKLNRFELKGEDEEGQPVALIPDAFTITHGISIGDPPVARSVGVARSSGDVAVYFERGDPLPAERSFQFFTVETVSARTEAKITIPLVQGDFELAHLCQKIGEIVVDGQKVPRTIEVGSETEITLRMDRGGHLEATARFPEHKVEVRSVAQLLTPEADPEAMKTEMTHLRGQLEELRSDAFRLKDTGLFKRLAEAEAEMERLDGLLAGLARESEESAQRIRRDLLELSGEVFHLNQEVRWPEVEEEIEDTMASAIYWVSSLGRPEEQRLLEKTHREIEAARESRTARKINRLLRRARKLQGAAFQRSDIAVEEMFSELVGRADEAKNRRQFERLITRGKKALAAGDIMTLRNVSHQMYSYLPGLPASRERAFSSGVE